MHFIDPGSECSISVDILADGTTCHEYQSSGADGNQQCWIAVEADQVLSVQCNVEMVARKYSVDLIVDGILRNAWFSSRVEKRQKRTATIDFSKAVCKNIRSLLECSLRTSSLRNYNIDFDNSKTPTIGTIEIQVSKVDHNLTHRQTAPLPDEGKKGQNNLSLTLGTAGVPPTHEIKFTDGLRLSESDRKSVRNKMKMPRPGRAPWTIFKYHYRLEASLSLPHSIDQNGTAASDIKASPDLLDQAAQRTLSPLPNQLLENGPRSPAPSTLSAQMISQHNIPSPNPLFVPSVQHDQPSTLRTQESPDSSSNHGVAEDLVHDQPNKMNVKHGINDVKALRATVKELQIKRDEARRRSEEEQNKTEVLANQLEAEWMELLISKADLERQIEESKNVVAAQLREQKELEAFDK